MPPTILLSLRKLLPSKPTPLPGRSFAATWLSSWYSTRSQIQNKVIGVVRSMASLAARLRALFKCYEPSIFFHPERTSPYEEQFLTKGSIDGLNHRAPTVLIVIGVWMGQ